MTVSLTVPETRAWSTADPYATALRAGHGPLFLHRADGWLLPLDVERWCAGPDDADRTVLAACRGATLDIGCGPGRMVTALAEGSRPALGIDVSTEAVRRTRAAGGAALLRSVFEPLPQEGHWRTALLIDGNIGIGGDPGALLSRVRQLVHSHGTLIVEAAPVGLADDLDERTPSGCTTAPAPTAPPSPGPGSAPPPSSATPPPPAGRPRQRGAATTAASSPCAPTATAGA